MLILIQLVLLLLAGAFVYMRSQMLLGKHLMRPWRASRDSDVLESRSSRGPMRFFHIGVAVPGAIPFVVRRERFYHRFLKSLGIASEIQLGDAGFDGRYFITTDFPGQLEQLLASKDLRAHVNELFKLPVKSLHTSRHNIWCAIKRWDYSKPQDYFEKHIALLRKIAADSQASLAQERQLPQTPRRGVAAMIVIAAHAGLLALGFFTFLVFFNDPRYSDPQAMVQIGAVAGAVAAALWLLGILRLFRGSPWSVWVLADFLLFGLAGFVLSGIYVVREANINLPQGEARLLQQPVQQKMCVLRCGSSWKKRSLDNTYPFFTDAACSPAQRQKVMAEKKQTDELCTANAWFTFGLRLNDWQPERKSLSMTTPIIPGLGFGIRVGHPQQMGIYGFSPSEKLFDAVRTGDMVTVSVYPGAFGLEWADRNEISASPSR